VLFAYGILICSWVLSPPAFGALWVASFHWFLIPALAIVDIACGLEHA
jgi:hypothetical protein